MNCIKKYFMFYCYFFTHILLFANNSIPQVDKTIPANGAKNVDPSLNEIKFIFNQPMNTNSSSLTGGGKTFPEIIGSPRWLDAQTFIIPVKLVHNHDYNLGINSKSFKGFKSISGIPVKPYLVSFSTSDSETTTPNIKLNKKAFNELKQAIKKRYAYQDKIKNWDNLFNKFEVRLQNAVSLKSFAIIAGEMLSNAKDLHIWLTVNDFRVTTYKRSIFRNYNFKVIPLIVENFKKNNDVVFTGNVGSKIKYLCITSWSSKKAKDIKIAIDFVHKIKRSESLIIDIRSNCGGAEALAKEFAGCFIKKSRLYATRKTINPSTGKFEKQRKAYLSPNRKKRFIGKQVAVLMGKANMSSCEAFILMMRQVRNCNLIGDSSYGSSGNPKPVTLSNGVTVYLPSWQAMDKKGKVFEGLGLEPDIKIVENDKTRFVKSDPVLEYAISFLSKKE